MIIALGTVVLLLADGSPWRLWTMVGAVAGLSVFFVRDFFWLRDHDVTPRMIPYLILPIVVLHTALIVVTGGADSPFLVLYVVMAMVPSSTLGKPKPALALAAVPITLLWLLSIGTATHWLPPLLPTFFGGGGASRSPALLYTQALVFTAAILIGGSVLLLVRAAVERTARTAVAMRHELMDTMRERNRELLHLSGELAHELKNPLASIQGLSALLERKLTAGSKEKEQMGVLIGEVKRMGSILDEFLNFSRPATGLSIRPVRLGELAAEVAQLHEGLAQQRGIALELGLLDAEAVRCDPRKVRQVLVNLLQNALDATPRGGRISICAELGPEGSARIIVQDTGPGLAPEVRARLFEPGTTTKSGGSGLGLTIARAIAEQHGGSLVLDTGPDGGCRATLELPSQPQERSARPATAELEPAAEADADRGAQP